MPIDFKTMQNKKVPDPNKGVNPAGTRTNTGAVGLEPVKTNPIPSPAATTTMNPASTQAADYQAWKTKQDELFSKLEGLANSQFSYDPNTDPAYQAQRDLAKLRAGDANRATMETMNDRGLLQSTVTNSQLDQNNQRAEQEAAAYIPQYREQAYGQFQDRLSNAANLLGVASGRADTAYTRDYQTGRDATGDAYNEAQLTGVYQSPEARTQIDALLELKRQAEAPGITAEQRAGLSKQADGIRSKLSTMGVDIAKLGANTNSSKANAAAGVQTMAGQGLEMEKAQTELNDAYSQAEITGVIGAVLGKKYGLPANTPTQAVKESNRNYALDQQKTKADIANMNADNARLSSGGSGGGSSGGGTTKLPALTTYANLLQDQFMPYDPVTRTRKLTNPDALERTILSSGYSEAQMQQLYDLFGLNLDGGGGSDRPVSGPLPME